MGPSREIKRLCCVTGSKSKRKHFNVQPGHPSLPQPIILLQSVHNLLSFFPKASRHRIRFSWLCLASWGCWMENWNKIKEKNANPSMPLWLNWCEIIAPEMLTSNPQWNKKEGLIWMSRLLPADPLLQSYSFLSWVPARTPSPHNRCLPMLRTNSQVPPMSNGKNSQAWSGSYLQLLSIWPKRKAAR